MSPLRFYFSFRSPYAWIAAERLEEEFGDLGVEIERLPVFPTPETFPNDPSVIPNKVRYLLQDIPRLAERYGLKTRFPRKPDTDWALPHAAFYAAEERGAGQRFMVEVFRQRFGEGNDVGEPEVVAEAARRADLEPETVLAAGRDEALRERAAAAWVKAGEEDQLFGVPTFVFAGQSHWGQDRMQDVRELVLRETSHAQGHPR